MDPALHIDRDRLTELCQKYRVARLEVFGSQARGTARPDSDVDLLVTFEEGYTPGWELGGLYADLEALLDRRIDLITRWTLDHDESPRFREEVLSAVELLYAA